MFRTAARYLTEPHPFARNPVTAKPHAVDFSLYPRRIARTGTLYALPHPKSYTAVMLIRYSALPMAVIVLGWPVAAEMYGRKVGM